MAKATVRSRQILCGCRLYQALAFGRPTIPKKGVARVTLSISKFYTPLNFSGMAEDRIAKFCAQFTSHLLHCKLFATVDFFNWTTLPYSPDLAPSDCYLFKNLKFHHHGTRFADDESPKAIVEAWFERQDG